MGSSFRTLVASSARFVIAAGTLAGIAAMVLMLCGWGLVPEYKIARADDIATQILVVDEQGKPIRGADVWRVANPAPALVSLVPGTREISLEYLDRVAARYRNIPEFARHARPGIFPALENPIQFPGLNCLIPTDPEGKASEIIKYPTGRPAAVTVKYVALRYGYAPTPVQIELAKGSNPAQLKIVLRRDPAIALPNAAYWTRYLELQRQFSGDYAEQNTEQARAQMIAAADAALAAGDAKMAARIYSWTPYLPTVTTFDRAAGGIRASGYVRENETSQRNVALLRKAALLDPSNRYIKMKLLLLDPPADRSEHIRQLEALVAGGRDDLWPRVFERLQDEYYAAGEKDKARNEFQWFTDHEPDAFVNRDGYFKAARARYVSLEDFRTDYLPEGDANAKDQYLAPPIYYAVRSGRVDLLDWLLQNGATRPLPNMIVYQAIVSRRPEMVRRVLDLTGQIQGVTNARFSREIDRVDQLLASKESDAADLQDIKRMLVARSAAGDKASAERGR